MKNSHYYLLILLPLFLISCGGDSDSADPEIEIDSDIPENVITTPCDFDLPNVTPNSTVEINCLLDLGGKTINLPENVDFEFSGGDIVNGSLVFSGGTIDGRLLSSKLEVAGDVQLKDPSFDFYASRWGIVEGKTTASEAFDNHVKIQKTIDLIKGLGATTFSINRLDVYLDSDKNFSASIQLPSDFHFKMSENTHFRVLPVDRHFSPWILGIENEKNITVSGGFLHGEREKYASFGEGGGVLFWIKSGQNIHVENMHISESSSAGLTINSQGRIGNPNPGEPQYVPSKDIVVTGCTFDANRGNNLSITDGEDIIVENCKLYRAGVDIGISKGIAPRIGIVVEPVDGQRVERVIIRDNVVKGSIGNAILVAWGNDFVISGNQAEHPVGWTGASNVRVIDNPALEGGIIAGFNGDYPLSKSINNIISGNTILNSGTGIQATNDDIKIFDNTFTNCTVAMMLRNLKDSEIYNNTITSNVENSFGINAQIAVNNVTIRNNTLKLTNGRPVSMRFINDRAPYLENKYTITDNVFECKKNGVLVAVHGIEMTNNNFTLAGMGIADSKNVLFQNNTITNSNAEQALSINKSASTGNIKIIGNTLKSSAGFYGIRINTVGTDFVRENTDLIIMDNDIEVSGPKSTYGIHSVDFDGVTIENNRGTLNRDFKFIYLRGDNATVVDNTTLKGPNGVDVEGSGNMVSNN